MKLILILIFISSISLSQKTLDLTYHNIFGKEKRFQFFNNNNFTYKLKGNLFCKTKKLANMHDSLLIFTDGTIITIDQIKGVKIKGFNFSRYFYTAGLLFPALDITNNLLFNRSPIINDRALTVGGILIGGALILNYIQDKHIRIRKSSTFRIIEHDFENLNSK